ncbi:MAG: hypothetical protein KDA79_24320, partial [Planctomycetaceae bacterium]|nr:hypothetical protein [Planctomycetaceae bacterium]
IAALRIALQERIPRAFIDLETARFSDAGAVLPDAYALKKTSLERFAAAVLPTLERPDDQQAVDRIRTMAVRLRQLEQDYESILLVCSITDWPWIREACLDSTTTAAEDEAVEDVQIYTVDPTTLVFFLGELPWITGLYERARFELDDDGNLSVDGIKDLALTTRDRYRAALGARARKITPKLLSVWFQYVRNLSLIERRLTPDLYTLVVAAQQILGDQYAVHLTETAREYPDFGRLPFETLRMGVEQARLPDGEVCDMMSRLPGHPVSWRSCSLKPTPPPRQQEEWRMRWNPYRQCSWPEEDVTIEKFRTHVKDVALSMLGNDLARVEKFTTSFRDGLDIRETLRNWHTGDLYVCEYPPTRGSLDCVVMLFDSPADPRDYPYRITWQAEHHDESTLALFATDYRQEMVGPGIGLSNYGGAMFLFPPRPVPDIWQDPRFDFADTLEERLVAAACLHSREKHVAILSHSPPGAVWRRLARRFGRKLLHVPLGRFGNQTVAQLRMFHVLNGQQVRSYAAHFIRKA